MASTFASQMPIRLFAHEDPSYGIARRNQSCPFPDGKPLSVVGRKSFESMDRVTGPDLMREIFEISSQYGWSHYFYGNEQKNLDALRESLNRDFPGLKIVGMEPSVFRPLSDNEKYELSNRIANSGANFAWIALGAPRQEVLMHELKGGPQPLMIGVGGDNVLAGVVPEAPIWMQNLSLEWLYRLIQEPKRLFKRYLVTNTKFLFYQFTKAKRKEGK